MFEAYVVSKLYEWSGFFYVAVLLSVLCRFIFLIYLYCNIWIRDFLYCKIGLRDFIVLLFFESLFILWLREGNFDNRVGVWFFLNYFVFLYKIGEK